MERPDCDLGTREELAAYRIETAKSNLKSTKILLEAEEYKGANNRAYYAVFHAINAIHALDGRPISAIRTQSAALTGTM